jgi:hypothetical protein
MTALVNPKTWLVGELVNAEMLNEQLRDNLNVLWPYTAKGALALAGLTNNTLLQLAIGANKTFLSADSTQVTGTKWVTSAPAASISQSGAQSIPNNSITVCAMDTENYDTGTMANGNYITIPTAGYYLLHGSCTWNGHATVNKIRQLGIQLGGGNLVFNTTAQASGSVLTYMELHYLGYFAPGATLNLCALQICGSALTIWYSNFTVRKLI